MTQNDSRVVDHPASLRRFKAAAGRWNRLKKEHMRAERTLWFGTMMLNFDRSELALLEQKGFLSQGEEALLESFEWDAAPGDHPRLPSILGVVRED